MSAEAEPPKAPDPFAGTAYEGSPEGWWTARGGALDANSGVVFIPKPGATDDANVPINHGPSHRWGWGRL